MSHLRDLNLSSIERQVLDEIRELRSVGAEGLRRDVVARPERLFHHLILMTHGNVQLRIAPIARELSVEMRTLERAFSRRFGMTMAGHRIAVRLRYAKWMLGLDPTPIIAAIAVTLGYERVQDFTRFFKKHAGAPPSGWLR